MLHLYRQRLRRVVSQDVMRSLTQATGTRNRYGYYATTPEL